MAADGTSIKSDIDSNLAGKGYRGIRITTVITILKSVVDWVTSAINGNLSTWWKVGTSSAATLNSDNIYRTGKVIVGRTNDDGGGASLQATAIQVDNAIVVQHTTTPVIDIKLNRLDNVSGINQNANFGWIRFWSSIASSNRFAAIQGNTAPFSDSIGLSFLTTWAGVLAEKMRITWEGNVGINTLVPTEKLHVEGNTYIGGILKMSAAIANKKISMYGVADNDHQYYGFGVNGNVCRYQIPTTADAHVFYAGLTAATSQELMRISGSGNIAIGDTNANFKLKAVDTNPVNGSVALIGNARSTSGRTGAKLGFDQSSLSTWWIGQPAGDVDAFVIEGNGNVERTRIDSSGNLTQLGNIIVGTTTTGKDITAYGTFKSYFSGVLRALRFGGATTTSGLTLKTTQYVSLEIDGTTYKLALVN